MTRQQRTAALVPIMQQARDAYHAALDAACVSGVEGDIQHLRAAERRIADLEWLHSAATQNEDRP